MTARPTRTVAVAGQAVWVIDHDAVRFASSHFIGEGKGCFDLTLRATGADIGDAIDWAHKNKRALQELAAQPKSKTRARLKVRRKTR